MSLCVVLEDSSFMFKLIFTIVINSSMDTFSRLLVIMVLLHKFNVAKSGSGVVEEMNRSSSAVLYIWSGQDVSVPNSADFVAVVDFDEKSQTYGRILKTIHLTDKAGEIAQQGNEPHHTAILLDGTFYITGGLFSFRTGHKGVFVWSIPEDPRSGPKFLYALDVPGACTDEFLPINKTQFIVSMMCNKNGTSPGDMVLIDAKSGKAKSLLKNASSLHGFNPHGFDRLINGSIFTADYVEPLTLIGNDSSQIVFRNTVRHFLPDGTLERTFQAQSPSAGGRGIGFIELKCIPNDPLKRCYAVGTNVNHMYLIGPGMREPLLVYDLSKINGYHHKSSAGLISMFPNGKQMLMTFQMRFIILMDITQPEHPKIQQVFDFCTDPSLSYVPIKTSASNRTTTYSKFCSEKNNITGTHWIIHPKGENRFVVVNYVVKFGMAQFEGTRMVHAFKFNKDFTGFTYDHQFNPNFQFDYQPKHAYQTFFSLKSYPHHVQYIKFKN